jgi:hypothetical protein
MPAFGMITPDMSDTRDNSPGVGQQSELGVKHRRVEKP